MELSPDAIVVWRTPLFSLNATLVSTWVVMGLLVLVSWLTTRRLKTEPPIPFWQSALEIVVITIRDTIAEIWPHRPSRFVPFVGTLFLFISLSGLLGVVPHFVPPTGSLSTTAALALAVFIAVPVYGISHKGVRNYLKGYLQPTPFMLPFHLIGEMSRTLALAVRLFGNMMSGSMLIAVLMVVAPLFFPILIHALELLLGQVQAYIFAILAMVYIASAAQTTEGRQQGENDDG